MRLSRAAFPSISIENADFWKDLISIERPFVFERSLIVSRIAAHRRWGVPDMGISKSREFIFITISPLAPVWQKMIASTMNITVPTHYWEPLRQRLVRNTLGHLPASNLPLVLYISRQSNHGRRLLDSAHADLVQALKEVEEEGICELKIAKMEELSIQGQIELAARAVVSYTPSDAPKPTSKIFVRSWSACMEMGLRYVFFSFARNDKLIVTKKQASIVDACIISLNRHRNSISD